MSVSLEDAAACATCFYRWHIDTALYDLSPPRVMTLYHGQHIVRPARHDRIHRKEDNLWKNPVTGELVFQVHLCGATELLIDLLPESRKAWRARQRFTLTVILCSFTLTCPAELYLIY
ncbi:hypothetical protein B0H14DRAFT_3423120 [Mycena olivaceomarginata]|nr:hypothetical protein B0H14DRAFT_3423120 [Mycena olivaceomarginata]